MVCTLLERSGAIVAFKDKIISFEHNKRDTWKPVVEYGLSIGIPKEQLDFPID